MLRKIIFFSVATIVVMIVGNILLPVPQAAIEVAAESIGLGPITNALFTSIILSIIILVVAFFVGRNLKDKPGGLQNIVEFMIEALDGLVTSIAPKKWAPTFFPIVATIFIFLLVSNWFSLLTPLLGSFGFVHPTDHGGIPVEKVTFITGGPESLLPGAPGPRRVPARAAFARAGAPGLRERASLGGVGGASRSRPLGDRGGA